MTERGLAAAATEGAANWAEEGGQKGGEARAGGGGACGRSAADGGASARRRAAGKARSDRAGARRAGASNEPVDEGSDGDAVSADGDDTKRASAGVRTRARIRSGVAVGSPKGSARKAVKRGSPNKPAGASRVRGGATVGSPAGRLRKAAKDGEGENNGSPSRGADVANVAQRLRSRRLFNGGRDGAPT